MQWAGMWTGGKRMPASVQWGKLGDSARGHIHCKRARLDYWVSRKLPCEIRIPLLRAAIDFWTQVRQSFNRRGFKLSPEGRWSEPKSYEQLLPPMHTLKETVLWRSTFCCVQVTGHHHTDRFLLLAYFPYFKKIKAGLWDCLTVYISP
jgi:hypothetical protein